MIYLLDTNVLSELIKPIPDCNVVEWIQNIPVEHFAISVLTIGEIRKGIEKTQLLTKKMSLIKWLEIDLTGLFKGRVVSINQDIADKWGYICGQSKNNIPVIDALIASSAIVHNMKLVTRNTKDFINIPGLELINPWY